MKKRNLSRRAFLQGGAAAGGILLTKTVLLEAEPLSGSLQAVAPSDRVRFGMIGIGMQGSGLLGGAITIPGVECVGAADLYDGRHTLAREITGNASLPTTRHYQELLDRKDIDCIVAAVPDHWHKRVVVDACNAGKDIYCEKPMSHTVADGFAMVDAAQKNNRIVHIGSQRVSSVLCAKARDMYHDAYGTGVAGDLMVHLLSGMLVTLGWNEIPRSATALGGIFRWKDGRGMPDLHTVLFDYHGIPVYVRLGLGCETPELARFMGPKGILDAGEFDLKHSPQAGVDTDPSYYTFSYPAKMREEYVKQWHAEHDPPLGKEPIREDTVYRGHDWDDMRPHLQNFFRAVKSRKPVVEDAVFGNNAAVACHMANESYFRKKPVTWDAASKTVKS